MDLKDELTEVVKPHNEITVATLHKIGLKRSMISTGSVEHRKRRLDSGTTATAETFAMIPYVSLVDTGEPLSRFEEMVIGRLNTIGQDKRNTMNFVQQGFST